MGMKMPSWFDIYGLSADSKEDEEGIKKASEYVHGLIDEEISKSGLSSDKILLGKLFWSASLFGAYFLPISLSNSPTFRRLFDGSRFGDLLSIHLPEGMSMFASSNELVRRSSIQPSSSSNPLLLLNDFFLLLETGWRYRLFGLAAATQIVHRSKDTGKS